MKRSGIVEPKKNRLFFLDHLKVALTMLVVAHHAGQPYGGSNGFWYFHSEQTTQLGKFFSVNAGFFMSLFFLISAYFLPGTFDRKGSGRFLKDRFMRLGIPLVFGFLVIMPIIMYYYFINFREYGTLSFLDYYLQVYFGIDGQPENWTGPSWPDMQFGHLWFIEHLLVYAVIYTLLRLTMKKEFSYEKRPLKNIHLFIFTIVVAILTFLVRTISPIDQWTGLLGFIQIEYAHFPQYASFFILGILAFRNNWFVTLTSKVGLTWLIIGLALALSRYSGLYTVYGPGGLNFNTLNYAFFETFMCTGLCIGLVYIFKRYFTKNNPLLNVLSENSYTVYIIHVPVVVGMQYSFQTININGMSKFLLVSLLGIMFSFLASYVIRKIPHMKKVL